MKRELARAWAHASGGAHRWLPCSLAVVVLSTMSGCFLDRAALGGSSDGGLQPTDGATRDAGHADARDGRDGGRPPDDRDGDGVLDAVDVCPDVPDPAQDDLDADGIGDACDDDRDGDGIVNPLDLCPDRDSRGTPDEDGDGITDDCDACPLDGDPGQPNADGDRLGDACEDEDPTRFSRVAFLATFATSLDGLVASGDGVSQSDGAVRVSTSDDRVLLRAEDPDHPGDYALDVRGRYLGPEGVLASGVFAALLRWRDPGPYGYALGVRAEDDEAEIARVDGGGCGFFGGSSCVESLASNGASCPDGTDFALRATAFATDLTLDVRLGTSRLIQRARDDRYASGATGLLISDAEIRFDALAIYAP